MMGEVYNIQKAWWKFLDGQSSMDTTAWVEGFAKYKWTDLFGHEVFWCGKPIYGIDRQMFRADWVSEYTDGKMETKWEAPRPADILVAK